MIGSTEIWSNNERFSYYVGCGPDGHQMKKITLYWGS